MALTPEQVHDQVQHLTLVDEIFMQYSKGHIRPVAARKLMRGVQGLAGISQWEVAAYLRWRFNRERKP